MLDPLTYFHLWEFLCSRMTSSLCFAYVDAQIFLSQRVAHRRQTSRCSAETHQSICRITPGCLIARLPLSCIQHENAAFRVMCVCVCVCRLITLCVVPVYELAHLWGTNLPFIQPRGEAKTTVWVDGFLSNMRFFKNQTHKN